MKLTAEEIGLLVRLLNLALDRIGRQTQALKALEARGDALSIVARILATVPVPQGGAQSVEVTLAPDQEAELRALVGPQPAQHVASLVPKLFGKALAGAAAPAARVG